MTPRVLVVEDDRRIAEVVVKNLASAGLAPEVVHDGDAAWTRLRSDPPDLVVLDIMLPGIDGLELTRRIRHLGELPILLLTARSGDGDKVLGFELGADDYLTKPFSTQELVARVRALLRRTARTGDGDLLRRGDLEIDPARREIRLAGGRIETTTLEFDLLHFLARRPGRVYTREELMEHVWGERVVDGRSIDSLVSRLRRKLESDPARPRYLQTVWGAGYRFADGT